MLVTLGQRILVIFVVEIIFFSEKQKRTEK